jgi:D-alanyl-D-alanine carboxypeptidase/D-alanyl-D-alanine-endopeptidase (penicillin-binding protein 4)
VGLRLSDSLPVVGETGTVRSIATRTAAQGHCIAKTGTLDYVTDLAGYCAARGGHMVAFALFVDGPTNERALVLISRMVAAIAGY